MHAGALRSDHISTVKPRSAQSQTTTRVARYSTSAKHPIQENLMKKPGTAKRCRASRIYPMRMLHVKGSRCYSAMKLRWMAESTFTPGPMVDVSVMLFT